LAGAKGATGSIGQTGPIGHGFSFETASGRIGPVVGVGTYFADIEANIPNVPGSGTCSVGQTGPGGQVDAFTSSYLLPPGGGLLPPASFSGMIVVSDTTVGIGLDLFCEDSAGNTVIPTSIEWWVSPVGS
jgi:hypothetical protein